ncbi:hypothetical protein JTE90_016811 [Oedothorax gibbosus]|uniref:Uncharacterized protein n=1 Tax=Oedothorax gibbosus TaxID=931172 RepID=A0AAV6VXH8_9ARAC|nr:hypothetical protein JTE90_016811 [Oedothorax gibbosus]
MSCSESEPFLSDPEDNSMDSECGPLEKLRFSLRSALSGHFFKPVNDNEDAIFLEIASQKSIRTLCLKCEASVPSKTKEIKVSVLSTSNLIRHLQRHHSTETVEEFKASLSSAREEFVTTNPRRVRETRYQSSSSISQQSRFDGLIVDYVIHAMVPLQSVDDPTFHKIFNFLNISNRGLKVMSRRTLTRRLDTKYSKHVEDTRETLKSVPWLCTTADIWSSGKRSFIGVTAHWIDENNERRSTALACSRVKGSHTYDRIATTLHGINCKYGLSPEKIVATVTDNGSNFIKAFRVFGHHLKSTNVEDNCDEELDNRCEEDYELWVSVDDDVVTALPFHLRCCAHTLALCASSDVHNAIKSNSGLLSLHESAMKKCNILWRISNRPKTAEVLEQIIGRSLPRPTETRWNSLYDSLKVIVAVKCHIEEINQKLHMTCSFSDEELTYLEEFVKCSKPVAEAIDILQGDKEAYYGSLLPTILAVRLKLQKLATSNLQYCRPIATAYLNSVNRRFVTFFELNTVEGKNAAIAALSYPKFKKVWFPCVNDRVEELLTHFQRLIYEYLANYPEENDNSMETDPPLGDFYDFGGNEIDAPSHPDDLMNKAGAIMKRYFEEKKSSLEMLRSYPIIHKIFKKYNTPLPSSAQVERLFSYATMANTPKSNRLSDEKFEQRVVLRANASS